MSSTDDARARFLAARATLFEHRTDPAAAREEFRWPKLDEFNWALDYFDRVSARDRVALRVIGDDGGRTERTFEELTRSSNRLANFLRERGVARGDRVLLVLPNRVELWEAMLACIKLGAVMIPATTLLVDADIRDRVERGKVRAILVDDGAFEKIESARRAAPALFEGVSTLHVDRDLGPVERASDAFTPDGRSLARDPLLLYFTSGTTAKPKLVLHTHESYPVGHLSTMYWMGLQPGDVHWNISSPGWAKHAWSNVFAPWNAEATVLVFNYARFAADRVLQAIEREAVTSLCAPPTVWRMLILEDLSKTKPHLREIVAAGEPLNPEIIERVRAAWGISIRDGYGQTETTAIVGNTPGARIVPGSMGRPLPGYDVVLKDPDDRPADEGELCLPLANRPLGLMQGYDDDELMAHATRGDHYRTGDVVARDADGYLTYVGRADDVFKSSDYRISPFELESALIEHPAIAEAAVVPRPDPVRLAVPKAFVALRPGFAADAETARDVFGFLRARLAPFKRVRRIEFVGGDDVAGDPPRGVSELPKTVSGKIRRVELRKLEAHRVEAGARGAREHDESDTSIGAVAARGGPH
ncbi:MAG: AMP-binding protein [Polyangiaceae bacterium]